MAPWHRPSARTDRKSTRLNSSHTEIYTLSLHDALPISDARNSKARGFLMFELLLQADKSLADGALAQAERTYRSEEHTSELQSHQYLHSFPTRRSSDLRRPQFQGSGVPDVRAAASGRQVARRWRPGTGRAHVQAARGPGPVERYGAGRPGPRGARSRR